MKSIPMMFNQQMVKALAEGRKTVTRRPVECWRLPVKTGQHGDEYPNQKYMTRASNHNRWGFGLFGETPEAAMENYNGEYSSCAPYNNGDLIWVRETFCLARIDEVDAEHPADRTLFIDQCCGDEYYIQKEWAVSEGAEELDEVKWKPSIHMPRKASRLTLRVTDVRCEAVQKITEESAKKEGVPPAFVDQFGNCPTVPRFKNGFYKMWDSIYSNWNENPWVWVIEFEVIKNNIDRVIKNEC